MPAEGHRTTRIGRYELKALIGEGGMGNVYRGLDTKTGRMVAVKVVNTPADKDQADKLRSRFMREVRAVSRVGHPNVVQVHDYGFSDDNVPYLVMELLSGTDLGRVLRSSRSALPISYVVDVVLEVCAAVRACHAASIVHRDLKPGNVFLAGTDTAPGWKVKVLDFGVAKSPVFDENLTKLGQIVGTLQYVSPEQVNGIAGPESDQYAIGVLLYACLTKHLPFGGLKDIALLKAIARGTFAPPRRHRPDLPESLEAIILRAMSLVPSARFESVYALGQQLWPFASRLGRPNWEHFYTAASAPATDDRTTTKRTSPVGHITDPSESASRTGGDDAPTTIARYDGTTVVGVDAAALLGSIPTQSLTAGSEVGIAQSGDGSWSSISGMIIARSGNPSMGTTMTAKRRRKVLGAAAAAILGVTLAMTSVVRRQLTADREAIPRPSPVAPELPPPTPSIESVPASEPSVTKPAQQASPQADEQRAMKPAASPKSTQRRIRRRRVHRPSHEEPAGEPIERDANGFPILP